MTLGFDYAVILVCGVAMHGSQWGFPYNVEFTPTVGGRTEALQPPSGEVLYCRRFDSWGKPTRSAIGWTPHS